MLVLQAKIKKAIIVLITRTFEGVNMFYNSLRLFTLIFILAGCENSDLITDYIAITDITVINVVNGEKESGVNVLISEEKILEIGTDVSIPENAFQVNGTGKFLIPGLWDMHSHHEALGTESLNLYLVNGVIGTRDMGSELAFILSLRESINNKDILGPEIIAAGPILDDAPPNFPSRQRVSTAEEARQTVRDLHESGVDFIKIHNLTPRETFFAIADETAKLGLTFSGHVPLAVTVEEAVLSGMNSIEHLSNYRIFLECSVAEAYSEKNCQELFNSLALNSIWQTPTLVISQEFPVMMDGILNNIPIAQTLSHSEFANEQLIQRFEFELGIQPSEQVVKFFNANNIFMLEAINDLHESGTKLLAGCDALVPGFCLHDEMRWMTTAGLTPLEALQTATINPAIFLGREDSQGTIEAGKRADLVLLDEDPLLDINNTQKINAVLVRGHLITKPFIEQILESHRRPLP